jgi:hypothetical protein
MMGSSDSGYYDRETGEPVSERDLESRYDEMLDECYGEVSIAGHEYLTSRALRDVDPIAYRVGYADFVSYLLDDELTDERPDGVEA